MNRANRPSQNSSSFIINMISCCFLCRRTVCVDLLIQSTYETLVPVMLEVQKVRGLHYHIWIIVQVPELPNWEILEKIQLGSNIF